MLEVEKLQDGRHKVKTGLRNFHQKRNLKFRPSVPAGISYCNAGVYNVAEVFGKKLAVEELVERLRFLGRLEVDEEVQHHPVHEPGFGGRKGSGLVGCFLPAENQS